MDQNQFFGARQSIRLDDLAARIGAELSTKSAGERMVETIAPIYRAGPFDICYISSKRGVKEFETCRAAAVICAPALKPLVPSSLPTLVSDAPQLAFARAAALLYPASMRPQLALGRASGISPQAVVDDTAVIEKSAEIAPFAVVGARAVIGAGSRILCGAVIGPGVKIGRNSTIGVHTSVSNALIGNNVIVHTGARIGQDGFGYAAGPTGMVKLPQVGRVILQDDVEIGANTTIDRGAMDDTVIGEGTKIDNLVQIGHNVQIGRHCGIVSQVGIAGSTRIGDGVMIGGQAGLNGHIVIGSGAQIAAKSGVLTSIAPGARIGGNPAGPIRDYLRDVAEMEKRLAKAGENKGE
ncbi:UDP-3-O-(3-hydroxymyristoyl)glucosamine N-acyltransferase [Martelella endophytica]|uniref:UDP-3-O-acylglucosamine N-acyltransferase n=1 Tax=Martelella endophytica TaxID=1486262 RepID=A0A0D5LR27_MAREN|nr:UDP-3-O-(3-hydroxymyristoyl)glucosamine N-acyltransferase [Martelella endophytica]AJY46679.1 UDP-3-O-(3-hydroxymyristoyl) glucosamine N-acyltransferase [Martelella endophytica]